MEIDRIEQQPETTSHPQFTNQGISANEQIRLIEYHFRQIMLALGLNLQDDSLKKTPLRVAKMYVQEAFIGLNPQNMPSISLFENKYKYNQIVLEKDIPLYSYCEHHFVPIIGKAHVGYIAQGQVIGLSKLNRIVHYCSRRPQVQERLTVDIADYLKKILGIEDVAVLIKAEHLCVASRGVGDVGCTTLTSSLHGQFLTDPTRNQLYTLLSL